MKYTQEELIQYAKRKTQYLKKRIRKLYQELLLEENRLRSKTLVRSKIREAELTIDNLHKFLGKSKRYVL